MNRFFVDKGNIHDDMIYIDGDDTKHIRDVLRLKKGERVEVSSDGNTYIGEIIEIEKKKIILKEIDSYKGENEPLYSIALYQGLAKGSKMDTIFQKCTEIGVSEFHPIEMKRSVARIKNEKKARSKIERWQEITDQAAKQSKRDKIPCIKDNLSFDEMIDRLKGEENIVVPYEDEKNKPIKEALKNIRVKKIHLIIGPEGGFEVEEIEKLKNIGADIVTLGPRILRTETAGMVAATMILYELGDLGVV